MRMTNPSPRHELRMRRRVLHPGLANGGIELSGSPVRAGSSPWRSRAPPWVRALSRTRVAAAEEIDRSGTGLPWAFPAESARSRRRSFHTPAPTELAPTEIRGNSTADVRNVRCVVHLGFVSARRRAMNEATKPALALPCEWATVRTIVPTMAGGFSRRPFGHGASQGDIVNCHHSMGGIGRHR
jgi:hypothetical protein